jgi:hypothetical protein
MKPLETISGTFPTALKTTPDTFSTPDPTRQCAVGGLRAVEGARGDVAPPGLSRIFVSTFLVFSNTFPSNRKTSPQTASDTFPTPNPTSQLAGGGLGAVESAGGDVAPPGDNTRLFMMNTLRHRNLLHK